MKNRIIPLAVVIVLVACLAIVVAPFMMETSAQEGLAFPDANFRAALLSDYNINVEGITTADIESEATNWQAIKSQVESLTTLNVNSKGITDLSGIEYFTALTYLDCRQNQLTEFNVSYNTQLWYLMCDSNKLTQLDVSKNIALTSLSCNGNQLTELNVSYNTELLNLACSINTITELDVSKNTALMSFSCGGNQLTELNVSYNTQLRLLVCDMNKITELDVSNNTALTGLYCRSNQLTELNVSYNTQLIDLLCDTNKLTELDVSNNTALTYLSCNGNQLTELNVSYNTQLITLLCDTNELTQLDVSNNTALVNLYCSSNQLSELNVSYNTQLIELRCDTNKLTELDVSKNTELLILYCSSNQLSELNVSYNMQLWHMLCDTNKLSKLDISNNTELESLAIYNNHIVSPDLVNGWSDIFSEVGSYIVGSFTPFEFYPQNVFTVSFKDWDGTELKSEVVVPGSSATAPATPTRSGYTFTGWDKSFDYIMDDLTVTATYIETNKRLLVGGVDTFSFNNSTNSFFGDRTISDGNSIMFIPGSGTYTVIGEYYDNLLEAVSIYNGRPYSTVDSWRASLIVNINKPWGGSCFGMSAVLSLTKAGRLTPGFFQPGAANLYALYYPRDSETVTNLINYYQLIQCTPTTNTRLEYNEDDESATLEHVVEKMKQSKYPVIISFIIYNDAGRSSIRGRHAVVGYDLTETNNDYLITIWDPNSLSTPSYSLSVEKDFSSASLSTASYPYTKMRSAMTIEDNYYDYRNIQEMLSGSSTVGMASILLSRAALSIAATSLTTNYDGFVITSSSGDNATVVNGTKTSGSLDIGAAEAMNQIDAELELRFSVPNLSAGETYTITPTVAAAGSEYKTMLFFDDLLDGFYTRIASALIGDFIFGAEGSVQAELGSPAEVTVASTVNNTGNVLYTTTATGVVTSIGITPTAGGDMIIESDGSDVDIIVSGDYNSVVFNDVDASDSVKVTETNRIISLVGSLGEELQSADIGYKISFNSMGGTPLAAIVNIVPNSTVSAPTNPRYSGYVFAGWYTEETFVNRWSFARNVTNDMTLYARWDIDRSGGSGGQSPDYSGPTGSQPVRSGTSTAPSNESTEAPSGSSSTPFTDIKSTDWFYEAVKYAYENGLMIGTSSETFSPNATLTRGMVVTVLYRLMGSPDVSNLENPFGDVREDLWYTDAVTWAAANGIVSGYGNGLYGPDDNITREQLVMIIYNYQQYSGKIPQDVLMDREFSDWNEISDWAKNAVNRLTIQGIINGKPNNLFDPKGEATRAEFATILQRFLEGI